MSRQQATTLILGALGIVLLIAVFFIGQAFARNLTTLAIYLGVAFIAFLLIRFVMAPRVSRTLCANCGRAVEQKDRTVFPGGFETSSNEPLPAILERRFLCQQCNFRRYEVVEAADAPQEYWAYKKDKTRPTISREEWDNLRSQAEAEAKEKMEKPRDTSNKWMF